MDNQIKVLQLEEYMKKFFNVINDKCPICELEIKELTGVVKLGNIAYHSDCYFMSTNDSFKIR